MTTLTTLLWDVDGTLAETERDGHLVAFNLAFEACGLPWRWSEARYGELLRVSGGRERLLHDMASRPDAPALAAERLALASHLHATKTARYVALVNDRGIPLRPGVLELMQECREQGVQMAIATTTSRANVETLLRLHLGPRWHEWFAAVVCGEDVQRKKPDPQVYLRALDLLGAHPLECVAIEDSPAGAAAARGADVPVIVTPSRYFDAATIEGAVAIGPGLDQRRGWRPLPGGPSREVGRIGLDDIRAWCAQMDSVSQHA
ncbi:MAG TPA: HAD-IA family hydrolase [Albitalea sp.]|nr:HAD-IA family hydrolase [Albitalea sp.]